MAQEVRTRFAPSPTGLLHIGGLRTALFEFLFARKHNGQYILRVEDTDQSRTVPGALDNIVQTLADFGLNADEGLYWDNGVKERGESGPYLQSQRREIYKKYADELVAKQAAYYCFCTPQRLTELRERQQAQRLPPKYDRSCLKFSAEEVEQKLAGKTPFIIRLNVPPAQTIKFTDLVHGEIEISSNDLDDQVLLKSDGFPTYHLAVVVDDHLMKITHVIRGDEWIPSTPKHILLYQALNWELPQYIHLPLLLSKSRKKLSKREGDVAVKDFLDRGYLPEALLNFVAFLGWNPKNAQEIFNLRELIEGFSLDKLSKSGAVFDPDKLDWLNSVYIHKLDIAELLARSSPYLVQAGIDPAKYPKDFIEKILLLEQGRLKKLSEIGERIKYFFSEPAYDPALLIWKQAPKESILKNLKNLAGLFEHINSQEFIQANLEQKIKTWIEQNNLKTGEVLWPLRVALTGLEASPGPFEIMEVFGALPDGREIIMRRLNIAAEKLF